MHTNIYYLKILCIMFITQTPPIRTGALTYMLLCVSDAWSTNIAIAMFVYTFAKLSKKYILYVHMYKYIYISESFQTCNTLHICTCIRNTLYVCCHGQLLILIKIAMVRMYVLHDHNAPLLPSGTFPLKFANH